MKAISYVILIVVAIGAAFFSVRQSNKFEDLQAVRLQTISTNKQVTADAEVAEKEIADLRGKLKNAEDKRDLLIQTVASLKATGSSLNNDFSKKEESLKAQDAEFAQLDKAMEEMNSILADLGGGVTLDNLPEKIQQIEDDKKAKQQKLEELEALVGGAEKSLATSRAEMDRLTKRMVERSSRINRNSMEAVITAVNQEWGFLVIGAGSNSGFTPQTDLLVERDGKMIGRVRPSSIEPTQTIAEIKMDSLAPGVRLQAGDRVVLAKPTSN